MWCVQLYYTAAAAAQQQEEAVDYRTNNNNFYETPPAAVAFPNAHATRSRQEFFIVYIKSLCLRKLKFSYCGVPFFFLPYMPIIRS